MNVITGKLYHVSEGKVINGLYPYREFIMAVEVDTGEYQHHLKFSLSNSRVNLIDRFEVGDTLQIYFHITGKLKSDGTNAYNKLSVLSIKKV